MPTLSAEKMKNNVQERMRHGVQAQRRGVALHKVNRRQRFAAGARKASALNGPLRTEPGSVQLRPPPIKSPTHIADDGSESQRPMSLFSPFNSSPTNVAALAHAGMTLQKDNRHRVSSGSVSAGTFNHDQWDAAADEGTGFNSGGDAMRHEELVDAREVDLALSQPVWRGMREHALSQSSSGLASKRSQQQPGEHQLDLSQAAHVAGFGAVSDRSVDPAKWFARARPGFLCEPANEAIGMQVRGPAPDLGFRMGDGVRTGWDLKEPALSGKVKRQQSHAFQSALYPEYINTEEELVSSKSRLESPKYAAFTDRLMRGREGLEAAKAVSPCVATPEVTPEDAVARRIDFNADGPAAGHPTIKLNDKTLPPFARNDKNVTFNVQVDECPRKAPRCTAALSARWPPSVADDMQVHHFSSALDSDEVRAAMRTRKSKPRATSADPSPAAGRPPYENIDSWTWDSWDWADCGFQGKEALSARTQAASQKMHIAGKEDQIERILQQDTYPDTDGHCSPLVLTDRFGLRRSGPLPMTSEPEKHNLYKYPEVFRFREYPSPKRRGAPAFDNVPDGASKPFGIRSDKMMRPGLLRSFSVQAAPPMSSRRSRELQESNEMADALCQPTVQSNLLEHEKRVAAEPQFAKLVDATKSLRREQSEKVLSIRKACNHQSSSALQECLQDPV